MALNPRKYLASLWQRLPFGKERDALQELDGRLQSLVRDLIGFTETRSAFAAYLSTSTGTGTNYKVPYDVEVFDALGELDGGTFTARYAGTYQFSASAWFNGVTVGNYIGLLLYVNRQSRYYICFSKPGAAGGCVVSGLTPPIPLNAGDQVEVYTTSGAAYALASGSDSTWFGGHRIA
jgi:hypothetical protein